MTAGLKKHNWKNVAQAASELAIFGAILIFVIGAMVRSSVNSNFNQNQSLKAMRLALRYSLDSAMSPADHNSGDTSRNVASLLFVEDRTTPDANKYGSLSRTPYIMSASGTFSKNLFKSPDWNEANSRPLFDMFINGKRLIFTVADYKAYNISINTTLPDSKFVPISTGAEFKSVWDPACLNFAGCRVLYAITPNLGVNKNPDYCISGCPGPPPASNLTADQRFDLHRDGPGPDNVPVGKLRENFSWQWRGVPATTKSINMSLGKNLSVDVDGDLKEEQILEIVDRSGKTWNMENQPDDKYPDTPIDIVKVMDPQEGDIDFTHNTYDTLPKSQGGKTDAGIYQPGLTNDMQMFSFDKDGTYLLVEEKPSLVSSIQKKNRVDIIQRVIKLSNNTGRFCPDDPGSKDEHGDPYNPAVEACVNGDNGCFTPDNLNKTCFDTSTLLLYVRSRIVDLRGRKWVTDLK